MCQFSKIKFTGSQKPPKWRIFCVHVNLALHTDQITRWPAGYGCLATVYQTLVYWTGAYASAYIGEGPHVGTRCADILVIALKIVSHAFSRHIDSSHAELQIWENCNVLLSIVVDYAISLIRYLVKQMFILPCACRAKRSRGERDNYIVLILVIFYANRV